MRGSNNRSLGIINTDGHIWSAQRRFALKELRDLGFGRKSLDSVMIQEVDEVIDKLISIQDVEMTGTFNTAIINVLWQIVASKRFEHDAPDTKQMMDLLNLQFSSGIQLAQLMPKVAKFLPASEKDKSFVVMKNMMRGLINDHLKDIDYDQPRDFIDTYLKEMQNNPDFDIDHLVVICLDFFQAGAETTSTTLLWTVLFMAINPTVQEECQKEIDENLGSKTPAIEDMSKLPYVMATLLEIQRISRVAPSSLPHYLLKDYVVNGYNFKAGTMFLSNLENFLMDPQAFPEPNSFKPERFLENGKIKKNERLAPFGIGKRICMGESLAKNELFIFAVRVLQRLRFEELPGNSPDPNSFISGITRIPQPFLVKATSRA